MRHQVPSGHRDFAKAMRSNPTAAERRLWSILRAGRLEDLKFKRQQPIGGYIVDFICFEHRLIVEADGSQHAESEADALRDAALTSLGYRVLRFWNHTVLTETDSMLEVILNELNK